MVLGLHLCNMWISIPLSRVCVDPWEIAKFSENDVEEIASKTSCSFSCVTSSSRKKRFFQHLRDQAQKQKKPPCALKRPSCGCKYANNGETGSTTISKGVFERVTLSRLKPKPTGVC